MGNNSGYVNPGGVNVIESTVSLKVNFNPHVLQAPNAPNISSVIPGPSSLRVIFSVEGLNIPTFFTFEYKRTIDSDFIVKSSTISGEATEYTLTDLAPETSYDIRMKAINDEGQSAYSLVVTSLTSTDQLFTIVLQKETNFVEGGASIPSGFFISHELWVKDNNNSLVKYRENVGENNLTFNNLPDNVYYARSVWSGGRTGLSPGLYTTTWLDSLPDVTPDRTITNSDTRNSFTTKLLNEVSNNSLNPTLYFDDTNGAIQHDHDGEVFSIPASLTSSLSAQKKLNLVGVKPSMPYVVIQGDYDLIETPGQNNQKLLVIDAEHVRVARLKFIKSGRHGIEIRVGEVELYEVETTQNRQAGILAAPGGDVSGTGVKNNGKVKYVESHHNRFSNGMYFQQGNTDGIYVDGWRISHFLFYRNGRNESGQQLPDTGGCDGFAVHYSFSRPFLGDPPQLSWDELNRTALFEDNHVFMGYLVENADDGWDETGGSGCVFNYLFTGNNGNSGNHGGKNLDPIRGNQIIRNNLFLRQNVDGLTGASWGVEIKFQLDSEPGPSGGPGDLDFDHNLAIHNNSAQNGANRNITFRGQFPNSVAVGNLAGFGGDTIFFNDGGMVHHQSYYQINTETERDPDIINPSQFEIPPTILVGSTVKDRVDSMDRFVNSNFAARRGGTDYGVVDINPSKHHATAADDIESPSDPDNYVKVRWFRQDKPSNKADRGFQNQRVFPPKGEVL